MHNLRTLSITFDTFLNPWELPRFRAAIARKAGLEHEWFHNHDNAHGGYHQRYPLIQYKLDAHNRLQRPMLLCLGDGVEEAQHFFSRPDWSLRIGEKDHTMRIAHLRAQQHHLTLSETPITWRIHKWKAFNPENYEHFRTLRGISEQFAFLEKVLSAHLIAFAEGVGWRIPGHFDVKITDLLKQEWADSKDAKVLAFTLDFSSSLTLPDYIGLGKGASMGWGVLRRQRN